MDNDIKDDGIKKAIESLAKRITDTVKPEDALKLTQSALNLAHTYSILDEIQKTKT